MLNRASKFNPDAQYVLAKANVLGSCRAAGDIVRPEEIGERRLRQCADQFLVLPTCVEVVANFTLADGRTMRAGEIVPSEELGAAILKRYLGLKLRPAPPLTERAKTPAAAGRRKPS